METRSLPNGCRMVVIPRSGTGTVATKVFVAVGSRHDGEQHGLSHCLEHLVFQGTASRTSRQVYAEIEAVGGRIDAQTTKEYTAYSVVSGAEHQLRGLEVLSDLVRHPLLRPMDLETELAILLHEIVRRSDMRQIIWDLYDLTLWEVHPLRYRVLGYEESVQALTPGDAQRHYLEHYVPSATVITMSGDLNAEEVFACWGDLWADSGGAAPGRAAGPEELGLASHRAAHLPKDTRQTYIVLGWPTVGMRHVDSYVLKIIERLLGVGGNSRLYQRLREEQGLVYGVRAVRAEHVDAGHLSIHTTADPVRAQDAIDGILREVERLQIEPVRASELEAAKTSYEGSLPVSFETNLRMAGIVGLETLLMGDFEPFESAVRRVRAVTADDVRRVANEYLDTSRFAMASVGPRAPRARTTEALTGPEPLRH